MHLAMLYNQLVKQLSDAKARLELTRRIFHEFPLGEEYLQEVREKLSEVSLQYQLSAEQHS